MKANPVLLQRKYARLIQKLAIEKGISLGEALEKFIFSDTYLLMREGIADMHCLSDDYLVEELLSEKKIDV